MLISGLFQTCGFEDLEAAGSLLEIIQKYVPDAELIEKVGHEFEFSLNSRYLSSFGLLFNDLESLDKSVGLASYGIEMPNLQDVFLK